MIALHQITFNGFWQIGKLIFVLVFPVILLASCSSEPAEKSSEKSEEPSLPEETMKSKPILPIKGEIGWKWAPEVEGVFEIDELVCHHDAIYFAAKLTGRVKADTFGLKGYRDLVFGSLDTSGSLRWLKKIKGIPVVDQLAFFKDGDSLRVVTYGEQRFIATALDISSRKTRSTTLEAENKQGPNTLYPTLWIPYKMYQKIFKRPKDEILLLYPHVLETKLSTGGCVVHNVPVKTELIAEAFTNSGRKKWISHLPLIGDKWLDVKVRDSLMIIGDARQILFLDNRTGEVLDSIGNDTIVSEYLKEIREFESNGSNMALRTIVKKRTHVEKDWYYQLEKSISGKSNWKTDWVQRYAMCRLDVSDYVAFPSGQSLVSGWFRGDVVIGDTLLSAGSMDDDGFMVLLDSTGNQEKLYRFSGAVAAACSFEGKGTAAYISLKVPETDSASGLEKGAVVFEVK